MTTGFEIDAEHADLIKEFIGRKSAEDGVTEFNEMFELMLDYWGLVTVKADLESEVNLIRLETEEAALTETKDGIAAREAEIDALKATVGTTRKKTRPRTRNNGLE